MRHLRLESMSWCFKRLLLCFFIVAPLLQFQEGSNFALYFPTKNITEEIMVQTFGFDDPRNRTMNNQVLMKPSPAQINLFHLQSMDEPPTKKFRIPYNRGNHMKKGKFNYESFFRIQSLLYDVLIQWNHLAENLGMVRWTVHGGSSMGAKCFGAMNPWDDDIDLTVLDCTPLDEMWSSGKQNITQHYPDLDERSHSMSNRAAIWDSRLIKTEGKDMILTKGFRCCNWYKTIVN